MSTPATSTTVNYVNMATRMATAPEAVEAGRAAQQTAKEIQQEVTGNEDWSLRVLTLLAGTAMMLASLNGFFGKVVTLRLDSALCDVIVFSVGLVFVVLESSLSQLSVCAATDSIIDDTAPFLRNLAGRGAVLVITGVLELYLRGVLDTIVGCFAIYVGCMYFIARHRSHKKLEEARRSAQASGAGDGLAFVQEQFAMSDVEGRGSLTLPQFRQFVDSMGLNLSKREAEAAFMNMDKNNKTGRLTYEAIQKWWTKGKN